MPAARTPTPGAPSTPRWLSRSEQQHWRAYLEANLSVMRLLEADLTADAGVHMSEYEVLVRLSEAPDAKLRMSELAEDTVASRSRLSHQITRMEAAGLVAREPCPTDRRGAFAVLTDAGRARLESAAPAHVASVRRVLMDGLTADEFAQLGQLSAKVLAHLAATTPAGKGQLQPA